MIRSMTAFASAEKQTDHLTFVWEIRSVNHRYLDMNFRLPEELRPLEPDFRRLIGKRLSRGKVDCSLACQSKNPVEGAFGFDLSAAAKLIAAADSLQELKSDLAGYSALDVLKWPGVLIESRIDSEQVRKDLIESLQTALDQLLESRQREGRQLAEIVENRRSRMQTLVADINAKMPEIREKLRSGLKANLDELKLEIDSARFEQEVVYLLQKMDVDEELDRLRAHLDEIGRILREDSVAGRRLDFLLQELNREANTLASKSIDQLTSGTSVEMKVLIEQMREQIQNIE